MVGGAGDEDADRDAVGVGGGGIAEFKPGENEVILAIDEKEAVVCGRDGQSCSIEDGGFAWIALESDRGICRAGDVDGDAFVVHARADVNGVAGGEGVGGVLEGLPGLVEGAGVGVVAGGGDVVGGEE